MRIVSADIPQLHTKYPWKEEKEEMVVDKKSTLGQQENIASPLKPVGPTSANTVSLTSFHRDTERARRSRGTGMFCSEV